MYADLLNKCPINLMARYTVGISGAGGGGGGGGMVQL